MRTIAKLFCTQIVRIFTFSCQFSLFSIFSTAMYRKIRVILLLYITKIRKYYKTKRGHIKKLTCPRIYHFSLYLQSVSAVSEETQQIQEQIHKIQI